MVDFAKWDAALIGESILAAASKVQMGTPFTLNSGQSTGYGFGWAITSIPGGKVVHHNGGGFGFNTGFYRFVDAGWSVIVLTNTLWRDGPRPPNNGDAIAREVAALYRPAPNLAQPPEAKRLTLLLRKFHGEQPVFDPSTLSGSEVKLRRVRQSSRSRQSRSGIVVGVEVSLEQFRNRRGFRCVPTQNIQTATDMSDKVWNFLDRRRSPSLIARHVL